MIDAKTATTIDRETLTITFQRRFGVARELVFEAWTKPEQVTHWWDPGGTPLAECEIDARPGGAFKFVNRGDAHSPPFAGTYRAVERPALLVFDALGALGTVRLEIADGGTHMTVTIRCGSEEHLDHFVKLGVADGTDRTLDNLVAYLARA
ncbi:MAG: SRPBCC domain-containing protein [Myxococcales bacterium]|nr:SRPBCC domain-containing protein [Myxococcales bacterium]